jgi:2-polyprenyl-6-methoxyphenol hydroxylase-like FAD-dependent oxidoreductase
LSPQFEQVYPGGGPETVTSVDRYAFRRASMTGLDNVLQFGKAFASYAESDDGVEVRFTDGTSVNADVLVGADGVGSRVRAQLLPALEVVDIGVRCIYGKVPLTDSVRAMRGRVRSGAVPDAAGGVRRISDGRDDRDERRTRAL